MQLYTLLYSLLVDLHHLTVCCFDLPQWAYPSLLNINVVVFSDVIIMPVSVYRSKLPHFLDSSILYKWCIFLHFGEFWRISFFLFSYIIIAVVTRSIHNFIRKALWLPSQSNPFAIYHGSYSQWSCNRLICRFHVICDKPWSWFLPL